MKLPLITAALALLSTISQAATVNLEWDRNPEPDIMGYRIYRREGTTPAPVSVPVWKLLGTTASLGFAVKNVPAGTATYTVTAYSAAALESDPAPELSVTILTTPTGFRAATVTVTVKP
ncbi:MAG: hypothetical protein JWM59_2450 [Verrucomicrobiales bacterium]|nr:hypothetical protein [Verrucomicrobiales bacterium]